MANDSAKSPMELARQIAKSWEAAQSRLQELRQSVEFTAQLARAQSESTTFKRERDKALRDLGEALWPEIQAGRLQVPPSAEKVLRAVEDADRRASAAAASITELLKETEQLVPKAAARRPSVPAPSSPGAGPKPKKK